MPLALKRRSGWAAGGFCLRWRAFGKTLTPLAEPFFVGRVRTFSWQALADYASLLFDLKRGLQAPKAPVRRHGRKPAPQRRRRSAFAPR